MTFISGILYLTLIFVAFITVLTIFVLTRQQEVKIIERLGKYNRTAKAGLSFKIPIFEWIAGEMDLRVQQMDFNAETKTLDNVFVTLGVSVQYFVNPERTYEAFYKLKDPKRQISAYIFDVIRAQVPKLNLDDVFLQKEEIANAIRAQLEKSMDDFGYQILQALVIDIDPANGVKEAMNQIQTEQRLRIAATEKGEAAKILSVKAAEAEAESKKLQGEGIANQRKAIAAGLKDSMELLKDTGIGADEATGMIMLTQYFDTMKDIGSNGKNSTVFLPGSPEGVKAFENAMRTAILSSK